MRSLTEAVKAGRNTSPQCHEVCVQNSAPMISRQREGGIDVPTQRTTFLRSLNSVGCRLGGRLGSATNPFGPVSVSVRAATAVRQDALGLWSPALARHCWNDSHLKGGSKTFGSVARTQHTRWQAVDRY